MNVKRTGKTTTAKILFGSISLLIAISFGAVPGNFSRQSTFSGRRAYDHLKAQCDFGPRNPGSDGHRRCGEFLFSALKKTADTVQTQSFTMTYGSPPRNSEGTNFIASFRPLDPERILLCAHWDTRPWADKDPDPDRRREPILGANDGASGVAVLLEIARMLHDAPPKIGVDIVFFDGEDAGRPNSERDWIQGSSSYASRLKPGYHPRFGILIDMVGDADLEIYKEINSCSFARAVVDKVWDKAAELSLKTFHSDARHAMLDDHLPLLEAGIPCIDIIDFDYPYWHTMGDTPDKCSAASLEQIGCLLAAVIYEEN